MKFDHAALGLQIAKIRASKEMKPRELAEKCGVSTSYINNLERGGSPLPPLDKLQRIANVLDVTLDTLFIDSLDVYTTIEVTTTLDKDLLSAFYALPSEKKECVIGILHSLDIYMNMAESKQLDEAEEPEVIDLRNELKESLYLQDILMTVSELNENQQQYILDLINTAITNLGRLTVEGETNE